MIDPTRLTDWFDAYAARLSLYARQWGEGEWAEDVVQEVFVALMRQGREPENVKAWLFRAVRNAAISGERADQRRKKRERHVGEGRPAWFASRPEDLIDAGAAQKALAELPAEQREVIVLRIWGALSFAEIATVMATPLSTVYDQYRAGLAALRRIMESPCGTKKT